MKTRKLPDPFPHPASIPWPTLTVQRSYIFPSQVAHPPGAPPTSSPNRYALVGSTLPPHRIAHLALMPSLPRTYRYGGAVENFVKQRLVRNAGWRKQRTQLGRLCETQSTKLALILFRAEVVVEHYSPHGPRNFMPLLRRSPHKTLTTQENYRSTRRLVA